MLFRSLWSKREVNKKSGRENLHLQSESVGRFFYGLNLKCYRLKSENLEESEPCLNNRSRGISLKIIYLTLAHFLMLKNLL